MSDFPELSEHGYQIERELGHNRSGGRVTYLATNIQTHQQVVIKQFQFAKAGSNWSDYDTYEREIQVLRGLEHSGIPCYLDSFPTPSGFCMVQEYKPALSLSATRSFNPEEIRHIAIALLTILIYLQNRIPVVIHRDIKLENILVDDQMNVYLIDFGFARVGNGEVGISSVVKGTLGFMPPEQLFNRQLTEASDLYGLGITLICLLTGTKSTEVGNLIDITYRVNFKPLLPKLSQGWVNWLEKMVEPRLKDRFANATEALAAIPLHPMRLAEATFSHSSLKVIASRAGETLNQTISLSNLVPETLLEGTWEVAPHPSDPPHSPGSHAWISVQPAQFAANQTDCQISFNTSKLMDSKTYRRRILLHANTSQETYSLEVQLQTAQRSRSRRFPFQLLGLLFVFTVATSWVIAWLVLIAGTVTNAPLTATLGAAIGGTIGFEVAAWIMTTAGTTAGATAGAIAGIITGVVALDISLFEVVEAVSSAALIGAGIGLVGGGMVGVATGSAVEHSLETGMSQRATIGITLLIAALGNGLGFGLILGFLHPFILTFLVGSGLLATIAILYGTSKRVKRQADDRKVEQYLIRP